MRRQEPRRAGPKSPEGAQDSHRDGRARAKDAPAETEPRGSAGGAAALTRSQRAAPQHARYDKLTAPGAWVRMNTTTMHSHRPSRNRELPGPVG